MKKVILGMSGGVDSSVAAFLLLKQGYEVHGVTLKMLPDMDEKAIRDAEKVAESLSMPWELLDVSSDFSSQVICPFLASFQRGETPNPCVSCNREVKLKHLFQLADERGYDLVATGHYARIVKTSWGYGLSKGLDTRKDQSYFLYAIEPAWLERLLFPLGDYTKDEVRALAAKSGLHVNSKKDSEDLCFVPEGDLAEYFLQQGVGDRPGRYIDPTGRVVGWHKGVHHYTIGQRKGLGIALGQKVFVTKINAASNEVVLGTHDQLMAQNVKLREVRWLKKPKAHNQLAGRGRYGAANRPLKLKEVDGQTIVIFDEAQRALTPGQSLVIYCGDEVMGGGIIAQVF